jgi:hypothetical protein
MPVPQACARLLKTRHERQRPRTRERALMQLEQLCSALSSQQPPALLRSPYLFAVGFPLWVLLRKELAETYIAMGFVGECGVCLGTTTRAVPGVSAAVGCLGLPWGFATSCALTAGGERVVHIGTTNMYWRLSL